MGLYSYKENAMLSQRVLLADGTYCDKMDAHINGFKHYAFSVMIFNSDNKVLLQRRAKSKYHSGGLWSNACCGHPLKINSVEQIKEEAAKRLQKEMGICTKLKYKFIVNYQITCGQLVESEIDYVFEGYYNDKASIQINKDEVDSYRWLSYDEVLTEISMSPDVYTKWFRIIINDYPKKDEFNIFV